MAIPTTINLHPRSDTGIEAVLSGGFVWINIGDSVYLHVSSQEILEELAGAIDQAAHFLEGAL